MRAVVLHGSVEWRLRNVGWSRMVVCLVLCNCMYALFPSWCGFFFPLIWNSMLWKKNPLMLFGLLTQCPVCPMPCGLCSCIHGKDFSFCLPYLGMDLFPLVTKAYRVIRTHTPCHMSYLQIQLQLKNTFSKKKKPQKTFSFMTEYQDLMVSVWMWRLNYLPASGR